MEYRPLVLVKGKLEALWNRMSMYPQIFDDVIPRTFEAFKETMLAPTNQFYEIVEGDETIGLAAATQVRPTLDANMHVVMFDRRLRGREPVLLGALRDFGIRAKLRRMTVALPEDNRTAIKLVERLGFKLEGVMRKAHLRDGIYRDYHIFGILAEELYSYSDSGRHAPAEPDGGSIREPVREEPDEVRPSDLPQENDVIHEPGHGDSAHG
jgi:hypothetical protein